MDILSTNARIGMVRSKEDKQERAVIFDFDGVLVNSEPLQCELFRSVLAEEDVHISSADHEERFLGTNDWEGFPKAFAEVGRDLTRAAVSLLIERKSARYLARLPEVRPFPGVPELIEALASHCPLAIASGSRRAEIVAILQAHGLTRQFQAIVSADEVKRSKPAPDPYLEALAQLQRGCAGLQASACLVVEDSLQGVRSAKAAGMPCLAVAQSLPKAQLHEADWVITDLAQLSAVELLLFRAIEPRNKPISRFY
jgi:HAD superfamily hydrolase (TIGR01509 family)